MVSEESKPAAEAPTALSVADPHAADAKKIVDKYTKWAAGAGLVPVPLLDVVTIGGIQAKMISDLAGLYGFKLKDHAAKAAIAAVAGGHISANFGYGMGVGLAKMIPVVGLLATPAFAIASTKAIGKVFTAHFASGGTLLDFDVAKMRESLLKETQGAAA